MRNSGTRRLTDIVTGSRNETRSILSPDRDTRTTSFEYAGVTSIVSPRALKFPGATSRSLRS